MFISSVFYVIYIMLYISKKNIKIFFMHGKVIHRRYFLLVSHDITASSSIPRYPYDKMNIAFPFDIKHFFPASLICVIYRL